MTRWQKMQWRSFWWVLFHPFSSEAESWAYAKKLDEEYGWIDGK